MANQSTVYSIGHSTHPIEEFLALLDAHHITHLADVRTVPRSRRHPQFASDALAASLEAVGIRYRHFAGLGGLRKPRPDSLNGAWRNEGFRGYADYMETEPFKDALDSLMEWIQGAGFKIQGSVEGERGTANPEAVRPVVMCAEAVWWRCHRQMIADALVAREIPVAHITSSGPPKPHALTSFAHVRNGRVSYHLFWES